MNCLENRGYSLIKNIDHVSYNVNKIVGHWIDFLILQHRAIHW